MKKIKELEPMKEIHDIRIKHYEETKNLSREEYWKKVHSEAQSVIKKYKIKVTELSKA